MKNLTNDTTFYTESLEDNMTLLNVEEAASLLMVGKNRIYELLNQGKLKGMRIGKSTWRIPKLSIYQFIREQSSLKKNCRINLIRQYSLSHSLFY